MAKVLTLYGTAEGQTATISEYIAEAARDQGHEAKTLDIKEFSGGSVPDGYDAVIVGASIHMGQHEDYVRDFVKKTTDLSNVSPRPSSLSA